MPGPAVTMESSTSRVRGPPVNASASSRDPRLKRTTSANVTDSHQHPTRMREGEHPRGRDESRSGTNTPQSNHGKLDSPSPSSGSNGLQDALTTYVLNAVEASLSKRKRDILYTESKAVQAEHERAKTTSSQFPIVIEQVMQKRKKVEAQYEVMKQETIKHINAAKTSADEFSQTLLQYIAKQHDQLSKQNVLLANLQREVKELQFQQTEDHGRTQRQLEDVQNLQIKDRDRAQSHTIELDNVQRELDKFRPLLGKANDRSRQQPEVAANLRRDLEESRSQSARDIDRHQRDLDQLWSLRSTDIDRARRDLVEIQSQQVKHNAEVTKQMIEQQRELKDLKLQLAKSNDRSESQASQVKMLKQEVDTLKSRPVNTYQPREPYPQARNEELDNLRKDLDVLRSQQSSEAKNLHSQATEMEILRNEIKILRQKIDEEMQELGRLRRQDGDRFQRIEDGLKTQPRPPPPVDIDRLRKSMNLKAENMLGELRTMESKSAVLQEDVTSVKLDIVSLRSQFSSLNESVHNLKTTKADRSGVTSAIEGEISSLQAADKDLSEKIQVMGRSHDNLVKCSDSLRAEISDMKAELAQSRADHVETAFKKLVEDEFKTFQKTRDLSDSQRDANIVNKVNSMSNSIQESATQIERKLKQLEQDVARSSVPGLSSGDRQTIEDAKAKLRDLEFQVSKLSKALEKQAWITQHQGHRFDNLTSETLYRQMLGVVAPLLPRFEQGLIKVEGNIQMLRDRLENHPQKAEDVTAEQEKKMQELKADLITTRTQTESVAQEFYSARDAVTDEIKKLTSSQTQVEMGHLSFCESINKKINALGLRVNDLARESSKMNSWKTSQESSSLAAEPERNSTGARLVHESDVVGPVSDDSGNDPENPEDSDADADEMQKERTRVAILEKFKKPISDSFARPTPLARQSLRKAHGQAKPVTKRKRTGDYRELDDLAIMDSDDASRLPPKRKDRRS